jgi:NitT/TauT family transport system substrate-binding protein
MILLRMAQRVALALSLLAGMGVTAESETVVKIGGVRTISLIPFLHAQKEGLAAKEGLKFEIIGVNAAPAVASAVASGTVDIGYATTIPLILARASGQRFKMFMTLNVEKQNDVVWTWLIASERSGVKTMKELAGKTIALNAFGALCELQFREHLAKAGVPWSAVKPIVLPVPQMPAALELGNADAACVFEPIYTAAKMSPNIKAATLATGMIADMEKFGAISLEGVYAREDWLEKNTDLARKIVKVVRAAALDLSARKDVYNNWVTGEFRIDPNIVANAKLEINPGDFSVRAEEIQPLIDAMQRDNLINSPMKAQDLIFPLD